MHERERESESERERASEGGREGEETRRKLRGSSDSMPGWLRPMEKEQYSENFQAVPIHYHKQTSLSGAGGEWVLGGACRALCVMFRCRVAM